VVERTRWARKKKIWLLLPFMEERYKRSLRKGRVIEIENVTKRKGEGGGGHRGKVSPVRKTPEQRDAAQTYDSLVPNRGTNLCRRKYENSDYVGIRPQRDWDGFSRRIRLSINRALGCVGGSAKGKWLVTARQRH